MNRHRIKLLITLVLFTVAVAAVWTPPQAAARGIGTMRPDATMTSGDPDIGQGIAPPPPSTKGMRLQPGSGIAKGRTFGAWALWTGRIWATLYLRAAR